jgi:hypothetical protein
MSCCFPRLFFFTASLLSLSIEALFVCGAGAAAGVGAGADTGAL